MSFIKLSPVETGEIYVNAYLIRWFEKHGSMTKVIFTRKNGEWLLVHETPEQILELLK